VNRAFLTVSFFNNRRGIILREKYQLNVSDLIFSRRGKSSNMCDHGVVLGRLRRAEGGRESPGG